MSFQAYLDNIRSKTGKSPEDIAEMVRGRGLSKPGEIVDWLRAEFGLGHGHSMAIVGVMRREGQPARSIDDKIAQYFSGAKARWRAIYDQLAREAGHFGPDVLVSPGTTYLSLVKGGRKFAIVQAVGERLDLGLKLKGAPAAGRLEEAGSWNTMVTHRVRITDAADLDTEILGWLKLAYAKV